jgi:hypothetical protein
MEMRKNKKQDVKALVGTTIVYLIANMVLVLVYGEETFTANIDRLWLFMDQITTPFYIVFITVSALVIAAMANILTPHIFNMTDKIIMKIRK